MSTDTDSKRVSDYAFHSMYHAPSILGLGAGWPAAGPGQIEVTGGELEITSPGDTLTDFYNIYFELDSNQSLIFSMQCHQSYFQVLSFSFPLPWFLVSCLFLLDATFLKLIFYRGHTHNKRNPTLLQI